jgi:hypothetical protein
MRRSIRTLPDVAVVSCIGTLLAFSGCQPTGEPSSPAYPSAAVPTLGRG